MNQKECLTYGQLEEGGRTVLRDIRFVRDSLIYTISVGTEEYIRYLTSRNRQLPENLQSDDRIFPLPDLENEAQVCDELQKIPLERLQPYLSSPESTSKDI